MEVLYRLSYPGGLGHCSASTPATSRRPGGCGRWTLEPRRRATGLQHRKPGLALDPELGLRRGALAGDRGRSHLDAEAAGAALLQRLAGARADAPRALAQLDRHHATARARQPRHLELVAVHELE